MLPQFVVRSGECMLQAERVFKRACGDAFCASRFQFGTEPLDFLRAARHFGRCFFELLREAARFLFAFACVVVGLASKPLHFFAQRLNLREHSGFGPARIGGCGAQFLDSVRELRSFGTRGSKLRFCRGLFSARGFDIALECRILFVCAGELFADVVEFRIAPRGRFTRLVDDCIEIGLASRVLFQLRLSDLIWPAKTRMYESVPTNRSFTVLKT